MTTSRMLQNYKYLKMVRWELPGGLVVRTWRFHCRGPEFNPWSGNLRSCRPRSVAKKIKIKKMVRVSGLAAKTSFCLAISFATCEVLNVKLISRKITFEHDSVDQRVCKRSVSAEV